MNPAKIATDGFTTHTTASNHTMRLASLGAGAGNFNEKSQ